MRRPSLSYWPPWHGHANDVALQLDRAAEVHARVRDDEVTRCPPPCARTRRGGRCGRSARARRGRSGTCRVNWSVRTEVGPVPVLTGERRPEGEADDRDGHGGADQAAEPERDTGEEPAPGHGCARTRRIDVRPGGACGCIVPGVAPRGIRHATHPPPKELTPAFCVRSRTGVNVGTDGTKSRPTSHSDCCFNVTNLSCRRSRAGPSPNAASHRRPAGRVRFRTRTSARRPARRTSSDMRATSGHSRGYPSSGQLPRRVEAYLAADAGEIGCVVELVERARARPARRAPDRRSRRAARRPARSRARRPTRRPPPPPS